MKKTIYIAKPTGSHLRLISKKDPTCLKVNDEYIKYGKSLHFDRRLKNYHEDNDGNIHMYAVVDCDHLSDKELHSLETAIGRRVKEYRQENPGRKRRALLEWCKNLDEELLKSIIKEEFKKVVSEATS